MHILLYHYFQLLSLLVAIVCYKGLGSYSIQAFVPLLVIAFLVDFCGSNARILFHEKVNYSIYNLNILLQTPLYLYLFYKMLLLSGRTRKIFCAISILCIMLLLVNYFFLQGVRVFNTYSLLFIEIINIVFACLVLLQIAVDEQNNTGLWDKPYFWINAAIMLFGLGTIVVLGLQQYIQQHNIQFDGKTLYRVIMPCLNIILYSGYSYAFIICRIKHRKG